MHVVLLCATRRGLTVLDRMTQLLPGAELSVFSFREEPWEPAYMDQIRGATLEAGGQFSEAKQLAAPTLHGFWQESSIDLMLAVNWRYRFPASIYRRPRLGTFVFHDSLLPEYRGFSPSVWAMINGENHTGVTLFEISEEIDAGDIVDQVAVPIGQDDTIADVTETVTSAYIAVLERNLQYLVNGTAPRLPQDHARATYTCKRNPEDNRISWTASSECIHNLVRAVTAPYPGAYTQLAGRRLRVWSTRRVAEPRRYVTSIPGRVVEVRPGEGSVVLTGDGTLLLTRVQLERGAPVCASEVLNSIGQTLGDKRDD